VNGNLSRKQIEGDVNKWLNSLEIQEAKPRACLLDKQKKDVCLKIFLGAPSRNDRAMAVGKLVA